MDRLGDGNGGRRQGNSESQCPLQGHDACAQTNFQQKFCHFVFPFQNSSPWFPQRFGMTGSEGVFNPFEGWKR